MWVVPSRAAASAFSSTQMLPQLPSLWGSCTSAKSWRCKGAHFECPPRCACAGSSAVEHPPVQLLPPEHLVPFLTPFRGVTGALCGGAPLTSPGRPNLSRASSGSDHSPSHSCAHPHPSGCCPGTLQPHAAAAAAAGRCQWHLKSVPLACLAKVCRYGRPLNGSPAVGSSQTNLLRQNGCCAGLGQTWAPLWTALRQT